MNDDNSGGGFFSGLNNYASGLTTNPLFLSGLQMVGNLTPKIGAIPNAMEGVPNIMMAAGQQQRKAADDARKQQEDKAKQEALVQALMATGTPEAEARKYGINPAAIGIVQDYAARQRQEAATRDYLNADNPAPQASSVPQTTPPSFQPQQQPVQPQQQQPVQPQPQQPAPTYRQSGAQQPAAPAAAAVAQPDDAMQQALATAASKFDAFGQANLNKTVAEAAASTGDQTSAAKFLYAAKGLGLSPDAKLTPQILSDPDTAMPLGKAVGIGTDLPDDQWQQAHADAFQASKARAAAVKAAQAQQQAQPQQQQQAAPAQQQAAPSQAEQNLFGFLGRPNMPQQVPAQPLAPQAQVQPPVQRQAQVQPPVQQPGGQQVPAQAQTATQQALVAREAARADDLAKKLRKEEAFLANPNAAPGLKKLAEMRIQNIQKEMEATPDMREYSYAVRQAAQSGDQMPSFTNWLRENKRAGSTLINTAEGMDAAVTKAKLNSQQKALEKMQEAADNGNKALPAVNEIIRIADKTPSGYAGTMSPTAAKTLAALNITVPEGLSNAEKMNSLTRQLIPALRQPGAVSNYEDQTYLDAAPGLSQSAAGRKKIAEMFKLQIERNNEYVSTYEEYLGRPELRKKLAEVANKPLFSEEFKKEVDALKPDSGASAPASARQTGSRPPLSSFQR